MQVHELHTKHSAEAVKAEKWQFEYNNLHDKYDSLSKEKEVRLITFTFATALHHSQELTRLA